MNWATIIAVLLETFGPLLEQWLADCLEPSSKGVATLRRFGPAVQLRVAVAARAAAKKDGLAVRGAGRKAIAAAKADIDSMSDDELLGVLRGIKDLVTEARDS